MGLDLNEVDTNSVCDCAGQWVKDADPMLDYSPLLRAVLVSIWFALFVANPKRLRS
jgi:hypothetical protein